MFKQHLLFLQYSKNVECIIGKDHFHICRTFASDIPRKHNNKIPLYEPYIPRSNTIFYNCTSVKCEHIRLVSMTQLLTHPTNLRHCYLATQETYACEQIKFNYYKNIDKLLFLSNNIPRNKYYLADCLLYSDGERVCHRKDNVDSHAKLVDIGTIVRPQDDSILSQDELICEETDDYRVQCDLNLQVPYHNGLKQKKPFKLVDKILLKTGSLMIPLQFKCIGIWCGYGGRLSATRRFMKQERYEPPGGSVYRCYYAKKQQICKKIHGPLRGIYNERDWLSS